MTDTTLEIEPQESISTLALAEAYAAQYKVQRKKSAEAVLEMARIIAEASKLDNIEYAYFCRMIDYENNDPTLSKFRTIGNKYAELKKSADFLPASWTSLYKIAKQEFDVIEKVINSDEINSKTTAKQIDEMIKSYTSKSNKAFEQNKSPGARTKIQELSVTADYSITLKLYSTPTKAQIEAIKFILENAKSASITFMSSDDLKEIMSDVHEQVTNSESFRNE